MDSQFKIVVFDNSHAQKIAGFQLKMAKQTQNLQLIHDLVIKAVQYLSNHHELGFYLVKIHNQIPIGSLLLTFQNPQSWWVQSVYVEKDYRRQGHFKSLFHEASRIAKQRGSHSLKLYAESQNQKAKQTYRSLGMHMNGQKFYTYDFVYGKTNLESFISKAQKIHIQVKLNEDSESIKLESGFSDILCKEGKSKNRSVSIYRNENLIGVAYYFTEFSQWRFGLAYYVDCLYIQKELNNEDINNIHCALCAFFSSSTEIKLGALRYIFTQKSKNISQILNHGQVEHYDVMELNF